MDGTRLASRSHLTLCLLVISALLAAAAPYARALDRPSLSPSDQIALYVFDWSPRHLILYFRPNTDRPLAGYAVYGARDGAGDFVRLDPQEVTDRFVVLSPADLADYRYFYIAGEDHTGSPVVFSNLISPSGLSFVSSDLPFVLGALMDNYVQYNTQVQLDLAGPNWDFSQTAADIENLVVVTPAQSGYAGDFPSATLAVKSGSGSSLSYTFYDNDASRLALFGAVEKAGTSDETKVKFSKLDRLIVYPLSRGTASWNDSYTFPYSGATVSITNTKDVLAEGTVRLPNQQSYPTLLVRYHFAGTAKMGPITVKTISRYEYAWLVPGVGPAVRIQSGDEEKNANFTSAVKFSRAKEVKVPDSVPPGKVTTLTANGASDSSVAVRFKAPGDDGYSGTAASYDLRYRLGNDLIDSEAEWAAATKATGLSAPKAAGSLEEFWVSGLSKGQIYGFAVKTLDEVGNISLLSNSATATAEASTSTVWAR